MEAGADIMNAAGALSVLDWWQNAGVDTMVDEEPRNWLAEKAQPAVARPPVTAAEPRIRSTPATLAAFREWLATQDLLPDGSRPGNRVMPEGSPASGLMIMIDMPEASDRQNRALLSDETGRLLERMLATIGRSRKDAYLSSLSLERPAGARLDDSNLGALGRLARRHIGLAAPRRVLVMGEAACRAVLGKDIAPARQQIHKIEIENMTIEAVATFAPRFLIQNPARKADAWKDLRLLIKGLEH